MSETRRTPAEFIADYRRGPSVLRTALEGLDAEALRARPIPGKLSALEVACHIVDSDQFMCDRMRRTIATEKPLLMGVESVRYVSVFGYHERDLDRDLRLLEIQREQLAADLDKLAPDVWNRTAVHSENGLQTLLDIFEHAVEHLEDHADAIYAKRRALGL